MRIIEQFTISREIKFKYIPTLVTIAWDLLQILNLL